MLFHPLKNNRGLTLIFIVLLFTAAATASVLFIAMGVKIKGIEKEGETQQRLNGIQIALQNYYLIHYDLPDPSLTNPVNSVPTDLLNLPQKYRFDSNGQMIWYDSTLVNGHMVTVRNTQVHGTTPQDLVAAVLVAPGPDKSINPNNLSSPYDDPVTPANDDLILAVSLEAEALKIAHHTVAVLQQAAKAYDSQFCDPSAPDPQDANSLCTAINNDADTLFMPPVDTLSVAGWTPGTEWYDYTEPVQELYQFVCAGANSGVWTPNAACYTNVGSTTVGIPPNTTTTPNGECSRTSVINNDIWFPNYAGGPYSRLCGSGNVYTDGTVPSNDEDVVPRPINPVVYHPLPTAPPLAGDVPAIPYDDDGDAVDDPEEMRLLERPVPLVDEGEVVGGVYDSYIEAKPNLYYPNPGQGCIWTGILSNDPDRGTASLDYCSSGTPAFDLASAYGLNLTKLGYDATSDRLLDPWGNQYLWGSALAYGGLVGSNAANDPTRDRHYWTFYSTGPDGLVDILTIVDDILPPADRILGYFATPQLPNPPIP